MLLMAAAFLAPSSASATPPTAPASMRPDIGFEGAYPPAGMAIGTSGPYTPAWWGRITTRARTGSYGLWCAGTHRSTGATTAPNPLTYPQGTDSISSVPLTQTADHYSSWLEFWYVLPSRGAADGDSFQVRWRQTDAPFYSVHNIYDWPLAAAGSWSRAWIELSGQSMNLSRRPGEVEFNFFDHHELSGTKVGEGVTIDDIRFLGYKYGPARSLAATQSGATAQLTWAQPARSTTTTADEERELAWRVWRAPSSSPASWTELTAQRSPSRSWDDTTAVIGQSYVYLVQAWDTGTGPGYGEAVTTTASMTPVLSLSSSPSATEAVAGAHIVYTYAVRNLTSERLHGVTIVDDRLGSVLASSALSAGESRIVTSGAVISTTTASVAIATATLPSGARVEAVASATVTVVELSPSVSVTRALNRSTVNPGTAVLSTFTVTNTGTTSLFGGTLTGGELGVLRTGIHLSPGASLVVTRSAPATVTTGASASFAASCSPAPSILVTAASAPGAVTLVESRLSGPSRIDSAIAISRAAFPGPLAGERVVVLASSSAWADALPAAALCGAVEGPLLLTPRSELPSAVVAEIARLGATKVYIVGGAGVVSDAVEAQLAASVSSVVRLWGPSRYATSRAVAEEVLRRTGPGGPVFVATGVNFADALAASSLAAAMRAPIVLTRKAELPEESAQALEGLRPSTVVICGGVGAVSTDVEAAVGSPRYGSPTVVRRWGTSRYDTARALVEHGIERGLAPGGIRGVYLATGTNFPDALAGGGLAAFRGGGWNPLMLTTPASLAPQASALVTSQPSAGFVTLLGGERALSATVEGQALALLR